MSKTPNREKELGFGCSASRKVFIGHALQIVGKMGKAFSALPSIPGFWKGPLKRKCNVYLTASCGCSKSTKAPTIIYKSTKKLLITILRVHLEACNHQVSKLTMQCLAFKL